MFKFIEGIKEKIQEKRLVKVSDSENSLIVAVPDIKQYLVDEYERNNALQLINEGLQQKLEETKELKMKYDASLVTLSAYKKRIELLEGKIASEKQKTETANRNTASVTDELNSYKIQLHNAALTKEEIAEEVEEETKQKIIARVNNHKGNLSKKIVISIIEANENEST